MSTKAKNILNLFFIALAIECFANVLRLLPIQFISKPSLMILLAIYLLKSLKKPSTDRNLLLLALFFSWLGDVILLIDKVYKFVFVFGLASFLFAHITYVVYFWRIGKRNISGLKPNLLYFIGALIYSISFYLYIFSSLGNLKLPVLFYTLVISLMLIFSLHAFNYKKQPFGKICIAGTMLFAISDSILAYNRFVSPIPLGSVLVMLTYSISQLLITEGAIRNIKHLNLK